MGKDTEITRLFKSPNRLTDQDIKELTKTLQDMFPNRGITFEKLYAYVGRIEFGLATILLPLTLHKLFLTDVLNDPGENWEEISILVSELILLLLNTGLGSAEGYHWFFPGKKPEPLQAHSPLPATTILKLNNILLKLRSNDMEVGYPEKVTTYGELATFCEQFMYHNKKADMDLPHLETYTPKQNGVN